jgi:aminopeptidase N
MRFLNKLLVVFLSLYLVSCDTTPKAPATKTEQLADSSYDDHSYSNLNEIKTTHLDLELEVNFNNKTIYGVARHTMKNFGSDTAIFDIKGLQIQKITIGKVNQEREADFVIGNMDKDSILGQPLLVSVSPKTTQINIYYQTTKQSEALDWLDSNLTSSKKYPFLYTQGQAILTRTWIPIQDSPSNRITYSAKVKVPQELMAVMSAKNQKKKNSEGIYQFRMTKAIPSYLIALAVGDLKYHAFSKNTGVYCEPELMNASKNEFVDLPKMFNAAERLYGKYQWEQYDLLILPYSFPFGGMENPMLTFVNPTVIAGDRSLVSVIAHELAHSWSGNLVTNNTWNDFWLNEGFTVYFENRIMEKLYGKEIADILAIIEFQELEDEINQIRKSEHPDDSKLFLDLKNRNPDDGMTDVAYVKGAFFLKTLEEKVGRKQMDFFLKKYFQHFAFKTINSKTFVNYLNEQLLSKNKIQFNTEEWIYKKGLPKNCLQLSSTRLEKMSEMAEKTNAGEVLFAPKITYKYYKRKGKRYRRMIVTKIERKDYIVQEWQVFIRALNPKIGKRKMKELDQFLGFSTCGNAEIMNEWFVLAIKNDYTEIRPKIAAFLTKIGRRKYLVPIYKALAEKPENLAWAKELFQKVSPNYHSVSINTIDEILKFQ